ncbi:hypothetical protein TNCV_4579711 [Trichonephila clavipes]|nr:hypothetical protein TNCV_4579711 [Trichonephila clavipes]
MKEYLWYLDKTRNVDSTRHSKPDNKLSRKKRKALQNCKSRSRLLLREAVIMPGVSAVYAAANTIAPYERILDVLQTVPSPD